ncbi:MFS transporter [Actinosynnema pretiosum subsp. pretiosum]|uniref:MFS transporter n=1 Tax=Actinosynnema pretiosum subsp. pretiosum TaxID=103721 RepID=A0AA45L6Q2_9PSEU|nr:putative MFS transporter [Actinosynnema pretiosum subsp. pretiosum]QUF04287.1 MFS transporter [Actinosynnema pretiosum subsp. pretiosum]
MDEPVGTRRARWTGPLLTALIFLVALNLRPAITSVGPLLPGIAADEGLSEARQGLLGALPLIAFGLASPFAHRISTRIGAERTVLAALLVLAAGLLTRSFTGHAGLWAGTALLGAAIGVGNVLAPSVVKRDYSGNVSRATGVYSAFMTTAAATASAVAVPLAAPLGWRGSLAVWAVPALLIALLWLPRALPAPAEADPLPAGGPVPTSVWRQPTAWVLTAFMGLQSTTFYVMVTWLPTIEAAEGVSAEQAGLHLFAYQVTGIVAGLAIPRLMRDPGTQVAAAVTASTPMLLGVLGLLAAPGLSALWTIVIGLGTGSSLVVALSLIGLRGRTHAETTALSGMAQSLGYLLAAAGPVVAGHLAERTGSWRASLWLVAVLAVAQLAVAFRAGRVPGHRTSSS